MSANFFAPKAASGSKSAATADARHHAGQPWVEKYRPTKMDEVSHQDEVVQVLKKTMESQNLPHLLFYGPPGTGKTSTILALAKELYGPELFRSRILELNASDERGINVVREKVKSFAQTVVSEAVKDYPCPPYKIVILDEADSMTSDAQSALRRTMETYSRITRFCLICNYVTRIIEPLASRCAKFRFKPLSEDSIKARLQHVASAEGVSVSNDAIGAIVKVSDGDLRRAITYLQSAARLHAGEPVRVASILEIGGVIGENVLDEFMVVCRSNSMAKLEGFIRDLVASGYSAAQFLSQFHDRLITDTLLDNRQRSLIGVKLGKVDRCITDGSDEHLQLLDMASFVLDVINKVVL